MKRKGLYPFRNLMNALDWEVDLECKQHCFFSFFPALLSSQRIIKRECQKVNFRRGKKMFALFNVCELPHFSGLFFFQVVFISTPPGQDVPGDKTVGNFTWN